MITKHDLDTDHLYLKAAQNPPLLVLNFPPKMPPPYVCMDTPDGNLFPSYSPNSNDCTSRKTCLIAIPFPFPKI